MVGGTASHPKEKVFLTSSKKECDKQKELWAIMRLNLDATMKTWISAAIEKVCDTHFVHGKS